MISYRHPKYMHRGQLLWLELQEFEDRPKIPCRVERFYMDCLRAEIEILCSHGDLLVVDVDRLYEEAR